MEDLINKYVRMLPQTYGKIELKILGLLPKYIKGFLFTSTQVLYLEPTLTGLHSNGKLVSFRAKFRLGWK